MRARRTLPVRSFGVFPADPAVEVFEVGEKRHWRHTLAKGVGKEARLSHWGNGANFLAQQDDVQSETYPGQDGDRAMQSLGRATRSQKRGGFESSTTVFKSIVLSINYSHPKPRTFQREQLRPD